MDLTEIGKEKIPINCRICENFLQDGDFIEEFGKPYVCTYDDDLNPNLVGFGCEVFEIGKWNLVELLQKILKETESK